MSFCQAECGTKWMKHWGELESLWVVLHIVQLGMKLIISSQPPTEIRPPTLLLTGHYAHDPCIGKLTGSPVSAASRWGSTTAPKKFLLQVRPHYVKSRNISHSPSLNSNCISLDKAEFFSAAA